MAGYKLAEATLLERGVLILKRPAIRSSPSTTIRLAVPPTSHILPCSSPVVQQVKKSQWKSLISSIGESRHSEPNGGGFICTTTGTNTSSVCYIVNPARHRQEGKQYPNYFPPSAHSFGVKYDHCDTYHDDFTFHPHLEWHKPIQSNNHLTSRSAYLRPPLSQKQIRMLDKQYPALAVNGTLLSDDLSPKMFSDCFGSDKLPLQLSESVVQMMMTLTPGSGQRSVEKPTPAQLSFVLLKLREELPAFFVGHHSYDMYEPNMKFEYNLSSFAWKTETRRSYHMFLLSSRLALQCVYNKPELDLLKITKNVDLGKIEARWRIRGKPRHLVRPSQRVILEGFSTFYVNKDGFIFLHKMDKVMPAPKERSKVASWLAQLTAVFRRSALPQPTAAILATQPKTICCSGLL